MNNAEFTNDPTSPEQEQVNQSATPDLAELLASVQEDTRDPVEMLDSIVSYLRQYLICDDHQYTILALWIVHTWSSQEFPTAAYLDIRSPEPQSGKTRCMELLRKFCHWPWFAAGASTATITQQLLKQRTKEEIEVEDDFVFFNPPYCHLLDDCHHTFLPSERQPLVAMLNSGSRRSGRYMLGSQEYGLFAPKAFAGNAALPRSLASRCIPIVLRRKKPTEIVARFNPDAPASPALANLLDWLDMVSDNPQWIGEFANETPSDLPANLTAHQQDCAEPLIHIADVIGGPWPARARVAIAAAFELADSSLSLQILQDVRTCFQINRNPDYLATRDLLKALAEFDDRPWASWSRTSGKRLASLLQPFGIRSVTIKIAPDQGIKGYRLEHLQDAWDRYLPTLSPVTQSDLQPELSQQAEGNVSEMPAVTSAVTAESNDFNSLQPR
jgi:hypothetical protein